MSWLERRAMLIVADDLSGAADCAAGFAMRVPTEVRLRHGGPLPETGLTALDLDSRHLDPTAAALCYRPLWHDCRQAGMAFYKKFDSTLRGNVASEIAALHRSGTLALIAPAFPSMGRTTVDGLQMVDGIPVDCTDVWRNEKLQGSADLLGQLRDCGLKCHGVPVATLRDRTALEALLASSLAAGVDALLFDAEWESDLQALAVCSVDLGNRYFWAGSAGLARHLAQLLPIRSSASPLSSCRTVLTVVGSMSTHSLRQAEHLTSLGKVQEIVLDLLAFNAAEPRAYLARQTQRLQSLLQSGQHVLIRFEQYDRDPSQGRVLSLRLAQWLAPLLHLVDGLIATGGETARAILLEAGIESCTVENEIAPGVVLSHARHGARRLPIVTKAGAFGGATTLFDAWGYLCTPPSPGQTWPAAKKEQSHA